MRRKRIILKIVLVSIIVVCLGIIAAGLSLHYMTTNDMEQVSTREIKLIELPEIELNPIDLESNFGRRVRGFNKDADFLDEPFKIIRSDRGAWNYLTFRGYFQGTHIIIYQERDTSNWEGRVDSFIIYDLDCNQELGRYEYYDPAKGHIQKPFIEASEYEQSLVDQFSIEHTRVNIRAINRREKTVVNVVERFSASDSAASSNNEDSSQSSGVSSYGGFNHRRVQQRGALNQFLSSPNSSLLHSGSSGIGTSRRTTSQESSSDSQTNSDDNQTLEQTFIISDGFRVKMVSDPLGEEVLIHTQYLPDGGDCKDPEYFILDDKEIMIISPNFRYADQYGPYQFAFFVVDVRYYYAQLLMAKGKDLMMEESWNRAIALFKESIYLNPDVAETYYQTALCLTKLQELPQGTPGINDYLKEAISRDETFREKALQEPELAPFVITQPVSPQEEEIQ